MAVDEALEALHATDDEYGGGLSNHGPMTVQALAALGAAAEIAPWVRRYTRKLSRRDGVSVAPVEGDWREVVRSQVPPLLVGAGSAAGHGCIRTAHAVALLDEQDTPPRRMELARALAYWRRRFVPAPAAVGLLEGTLANALVSVAARGPAASAGLISDELVSVGPLPAFEVSLDALIDAAAGVLLAGPKRSTIALVHAVTTPAALQRLSPYVGIEAATAAAWPVVAALVALYSDDGRTAEPVESVDVDTAIAASLESGDEHAIKLAAACATRPHAIHAAAVAATARRLR